MSHLTRLVSSKFIFTIQIKYVLHVADIDIANIRKYGAVAHYFKGKGKSVPLQARGAQRVPGS